MSILIQKQSMAEHLGLFVFLSFIEKGILARLYSVILGYFIVSDLFRLFSKAIAVYFYILVFCSITLLNS